MSGAAPNPDLPAVAPLAWPATPALAVAFVYLRAQAGGDFFSDVPFAWSAGELRRDGITADVFELRYERGEPDYNRALDAALVERLRRGGYGLVVVESCWQPEFIDAVHALGAWLCETSPAAVHPGRHVDFVVRHYTRDRQPLRTLVARLRRGARLDGLRNLRAWSSAEGRLIALGPEQPVPTQPSAELPFCPVEAPIRIGVAMDLQGASPPVRRSLDTNDGCPFSQPVVKNPAFADVDLSAPDVTLAGCSFCFMGGDYRALPVAATVAVHIAQITTWQRSDAGLDEVVLRDQHAIRYLPDLLRALIDAGVAPVGVLVPGRGDAILRYADALEEAATIAADTGFWFALYLIGFESFSEPQLNRFNKGVTPADYGLALQRLRELHARAPSSFRLYAYGSSSFILWEPWTTLNDLTANVAFIEHHAVARLSSGLAATRLRLYPNLPLYWRAKRDDLLVAGEAAADRGAAQTGYAAEARWRTADGRVAVVEELVRRLLQHTRAPAQVGVVKAVTAWGARRWSTALPPIDAGDLSPQSTRGSELEAALREDIAAVEAGWLTMRSAWRSVEDHLNRDDATPERSDDAPMDWQTQAARWRERRQRDAAQTAQRASETLQVGASCNNRCATCIGRHDQFEVDSERLRDAAQLAGKSGGTLTVTGREPTLLPGLLRIVQTARRAGATGVELVSNGRALATPGAAKKIRRAGVTQLLLKRHHVMDRDEDAYVRAPGAAAQLDQGITALRAAGLRWRALLIPTGDAPEELPQLVRWAHGRQASGVQIEVRIDEVGLGATAAWARALRAAEQVGQELGIPVHLEGD